MKGQGICPLRRASFPIVVVRTQETLRAETEIRDALATERLATKTVSAVDGVAALLKEIDTVSGVEGAALIIKDWDFFAQNAAVVAALRDKAVPSLSRRDYGIIVGLSVSGTVPDELCEYIRRESLDLPDIEGLKDAVNEIVEGSDGRVVRPSDAELAALAEGSRGLGRQKAMDVIALSAVRNGGQIRLEDVIEAKTKELSSLPGVTARPAGEQVALGGLGRFKEWAQQTKDVWESRRLRPKGIVAVGPPGTGKSYAARWLGGQLGFPTLLWNIGACKHSLLGRTEANVNAVLAAAAAMAPVVMFIDEVEKFIGGYTSSSVTDGGVTSSVVGTLLTFMQEQKNILFFCTCNDTEKVPPELLRAGRIDCTFFFDIPKKDEQREIAQIHLSNLVESFSPKDVEFLVDCASGMTGAEIEQSVLNAARLAWQRGERGTDGRARRLSESDIEKGAAMVSRTVDRDRGRLAAMREQAVQRGWRFANSPEKGGRV